LIVGIGLFAWYLWDKFGGETEGEKKKTPKKPGSSKRTDSHHKTESDKDSDKAKSKAKKKGHGDWFDFFYGLVTGNDVDSTATDEQEFQGGPLNKSGPFKGYRSTGYWNAYLNDKQTEKWLKTADGRKWAEKVQGYLKAQKKEGGALTKKEVEATRKYVPLPKSAPTIRYKDARGDWYNRRGDKIWRATVFDDLDESNKSAADALRKQAENMRKRHG